MIASRRTFLKTTALGGASLIIGFNGSRIFAADRADAFKPNGWVKIDPDGTVTLTMGKSEIGERLQCGVVNVFELADAVFLQRSILFPRLVRIAEKADKQLVNAQTRSLQTKTPL